MVICRIYTYTHAHAYASTNADGCNDTLLAGKGAVSCEDGYEHNMVKLPHQNRLRR